MAGDDGRLELSCHLSLVLQAAVEYFRLMLPPWDASGTSNDWEIMAVRLSDNLGT